MKLKVLTFNMHKGYGVFKRNYTMAKIRRLLEESGTDVVFLQEIHGIHPTEHTSKRTPLEDLADELWPHFKHGVNSIYPSNFHGNAIMSRYPIVAWTNHDISTNVLEKRGLLHARIEIPDQGEVDLYCTHLNLFISGQIWQIRRIGDVIRRESQANSVILAGDFNDWSRYCDLMLTRRNGFHRVGLVRTYPSYKPMLSLDRIYYKGLEMGHYHTLNSFKESSDHLPIVASFNLP